MRQHKLEEWETLFRAKLQNKDRSMDSAHDLLHIYRVVTMAKRLASAEGANLDIVVPSAWLHDLVAVAKKGPGRSQASRKSALRAEIYLRNSGYDQALLPEIRHCIEAHSFSANIEAKTIEAKVVQDADRLDALGAIGIARVFAQSIPMKQSFYSEVDPFAERQERDLDDSRYTLDHFKKKTFLIPKRLHTETARLEASRRMKLIKIFMDEIRHEIVNGLGMRTN